MRSLSVVLARGPVVANLLLSVYCILVTWSWEVVAHDRGALGRVADRHRTPTDSDPNSLVPVSVSAMPCSRAVIVLVHQCLR
jgi:hypothetical protein